MHLNDDSMPNYYKQDETEAYYFKKKERERERWNRSASNK